jgi:hypothetical protein
VDKTQLHTVGTTRLQIELKPKIWIEPSRLLDQIARAGFQPRHKDVLFTLGGSLAKKDSEFLLVVDDIKSKPMIFRILFEEGKPKEGKARKAIDELMERAGKLEGQPVELEGWWRRSEDPKYSGVLLLKRVEGVKKDEG